MEDNSINSLLEELNYYEGLVKKAKNSIQKAIFEFEVAVTKRELREKDYILE